MVVRILVIDEGVGSNPTSDKTIFSKHNQEMKKCLPAPGEARTHGLQIMRLTRCLLRYGGTMTDTLRGNIIVFKLVES